METSVYEKIRIPMFVAFVLFGFMFSSTYLFILNNQENSVLSVTDNVQVQATVGACLFTATVYPQRRIPNVGNWDTILTVEAYDLGNVKQAEFTINTDTTGTGTYNLCDNGISLNPGTYNFYLTGYSHLRKSYPNVASFTFSESSYDFTPFGELLAGETSLFRDEFINALDISRQVDALYTSDYKQDLNQDTSVNGLDISNTVDNLYVLGDI